MHATSLLFNRKNVVTSVSEYGFSVIGTKFRIDMLACQHLSTKILKLLTDPKHFAIGGASYSSSFFLVMGHPFKA